MAEECYLLKLDLRDPRAFLTSTRLIDESRILISCLTRVVSAPCSYHHFSIIILLGELLPRFRPWYHTFHMRIFLWRDSSSSLLTIVPIQNRFVELWHLIIHSFAHDARLRPVCVSYSTFKLCHAGTGCFKFIILMLNKFGAFLIRDFVERERLTLVVEFELTQPNSNKLIRIIKPLRSKC